MPTMQSIDAELTTDAPAAAKGGRAEGAHRR